MLLLDLASPYLSEAVSLDTFLNEQCALVQKLRLILCYSFLPDECIFVGVGLYLRSVDEDLFAADLSEIHQVIHRHRKILICDLSEMERSESCYGCMIGCGLTFQKIHVIDVSPACFFNAS